MSDKFSAGAYIIRNKQTSSVLHMKHYDGRFRSQLLAHEQDEGIYGGQQIWWVEPLCDHGEDGIEKGMLCSITNPSSGTALDLSPSSENICSHLHHGETWQRWRLRRVADDNDGKVAQIYYNLVSVFNGHVIDINTTKPGDPEHTIHGQVYCPKYDQHSWEFVIPVVSFPPGWFEIQNVGTGDLLSQKYVYNSPVLLAPPESPRPCQDRDSWQFQWTLTHSKYYDPKFAGGRNSWRIVNRLTGAGLSYFFGNITPEEHPHHPFSFTWKLELDPSCNWKIGNIASSCFLEQSSTVVGPGVAPVCGQQKFALKGGAMSWMLRPPLVQTIDGSPPAYETSKSSS